MTSATEPGVSGAYVDSSALAKVFIDEPGSDAMREVVEAMPISSSALLVAEVVRAVRRRHPEMGDVALARLNRVDTVPIGPDVLVAAAFVGPLALKAADAIHLATAYQLHPHVSPLLTYDRRLAAAANALGLTVASPR
jgi:uncharacterized protein